MSVRTLGGFTHTDPVATILDDDQVWVDSARSTSPIHMPFSVVKANVLAASLQQHTAPAYSPVVFAALPQSITGAGAVSVVTHSTNATSDGAAQALTLADGTIVGQLKMVTHVADGGSLVMTPVSFVDGATVTFTTGGERWVGVWLGALIGWQTIELGNVADGGAVLPAIA